MPLDLVNLLCSRLNVVELMRLSSVCKAWTSLPTHSMDDKKAWPLLLQYSKNSSTCRLYDPIYGYQYSCEIKELESCEKIWSSNNGWILLSRLNQSPCILNPFTGVVVNLPCSNLFRYEFWNKMIITSTREVIAIYYSYPYVNIYFWKPGMTTWVVDEISVHFQSLPILSSNFIFLNEKLYCLDVEGYLRIFDRREKTMQVVDDLPDQFEYEDGCLLEYKGDIFCVYLCYNPQQTYVYRLDKTDSGEHRWTKIDDIEDVTIFLNRRATFAIPSPLERFANRIYHPKFDGDESEHLKSFLFYCMQTRSHHPPKVYGLTVPINCVWIEPDLQKTAEKGLIAEMAHGETGPTVGNSSASKPDSERPGKSASKAKTSSENAKHAFGKEEEGFRGYM
ncbi:F-box protein family-like [Rhynchospora pubera]|uniref:F-box protein family-like n=1 Tax=Rhynchospora pubera TaxID=906938 RepID=A0AAV8GGX9_9POAL|nr:F-box protein family-like [Rhynchospora pubera]